MGRQARGKRTLRIFRYDPDTTGDTHFDRFQLDIENDTTTVLDALLRIQRERDQSLAFRYACRVSMCGSCGMVINGRERLACSTLVTDLPGDEVTIRPLNHFPVVKDLVVDLDDLFERLQDAVHYFEPSRPTIEPAIIDPRSRERTAIGLSTDCIACGCCVSSCTMVRYHPRYLGPAALTRAFTLLADSRDGLHEQRLAQVLESCYNCRLELNCTEVCPKEISPTRAIKYIQRLALKDSLTKEARSAARRRHPSGQAASPIQELPRRRFLENMTYGLGAGIALVVGSVSLGATIGPAIRGSSKQWVSLGQVEDFPPGEVVTVNVTYNLTDGFYSNQVTKPVMVHRRADGDLLVYNSSCTHLGCTLRWDDSKQQFLCACHGGAFDIDGQVRAGPPPRPLDVYPFEVRDGSLLIEVGTV